MTGRRAQPTPTQQRILDDLRSNAAYMEQRQKREDELIEEAEAADIPDTWIAEILGCERKTVFNRRRARLGSKP